MSIKSQLNLNEDQYEALVEMLEHEGFKVLCEVVLVDQLNRYKDKVVASSDLEVLNSLHSYKGASSIINFIKGIKSVKHNGHA